MICKSIRLMIVSLIAVSAVGGEAAENPKRLIEFGWDEPDPAFMRKHIDQLEASPFDGCVFHVNYKRPQGKTGSFTWECWGKQAFTQDEVQPAIDDLKATPFKRCRHNFLRFNVTPGGIDWFDDFSAVITNAKLAGVASKEGRCPGILFDIEQYNAPLFDYRKQRDTKTKPWNEYAAQVCKRGREVMQAFQEGHPGLTIFLTFGYCLPWSYTEGLKKPLADCDYGLLAPLLDGMLEAANPGVRFVDGDESAYSYMEAKKFTRGYRMMQQDVLQMVADPEKYRRQFSFSFGIWLDYDWRKKGWNTDEPERNVHTPASFETTVTTALRTADEYVWIYTETPRWWSDKGGPVKLPKAYDQALRRAWTAANVASRPASTNSAP